MANLSRRFPTGTCALVRSFSTEVRAEVGGADRLYRRLTALGNKKGAVASTINEYIREGKKVSKFELENCIKQLRKYKSFNHALEIMEWMEVRKFNFTHGDHAIRMHLILKAKGVEAAENYFSALSPSAKVHSTYGALLNCYCEEKMTDKALDLFAKMVKEGMIRKSLPFNNVMSLYLRLGQPEKVAILREEMRKMNINPDTFTYNLLMNSYSRLNDIEAAEKAFEEMKRDDEKQCTWTTYSNLAILYQKGGYNDKAALALKNLEKEMQPHDREAYHFLISLYAGLSDLQNVHRVWKSLKSTLRVVTNKSYTVMIHALRNLGDMKGLQKCFEEWESRCSSYDLRLPNTVIGAYLAHDMLEEATSVLQNAMKRSEGPFFYAWELFMGFFLKNHKIEPALKMMDVASSKAQNQNNDWAPKPDIKDGFLNYFKKAGDVSGAEEFYEYMKRINGVDENVVKLLLETYVAAGRTQLDMRARVEGDGIEVSDELEGLLAIVCPE